LFFGNKNKRYNLIKKIKKTTYGGACTESSTCDSYQGLICNSGMCGCLTSQYWNGSTFSCNTLLNRTFTCTNTTQCNTNIALVCIYSNTKNLTTCDCDSSNYCNLLFRICFIIQRNCFEI
jgi:hypothetical protein